MNTLDINTIAFQYLLRNNNSEESSTETLKYDPAKQRKTEKSLLFHLYDLKEEAEDILA
ncbi:hypothetical protein NU08_1088 [Flavobacterium anhuiense]|uniref:Uncharacterized protein n=1 Tax=Flavobacterium anhuiense TaxID=459526 RepID=A0A444W3Q1_9FLAO|nr:hypothetical protein [Flavobacterium anhuiense]RYJ40332.1 hypothetical protein NU08_1088 [Flavobacterium anhuiense]